jgi:peptide/nickel transport system ATP-binding protein
MTAAAPATTALEVRNLSVVFRTEAGRVQALDDVSLHVSRDEVLGIVGESGCGKSTLGMSIMGLLPASATVEQGGVLLAGEDLVRMSRHELEKVRGSRIGMVFQEPMTALNPVMTVGRQIAEVLRTHQPVSKQQAMARALDLLDLVGLPDPRRQASSYPHQLSGGMRQRVVIAIAIACEPEVLIADEPTTALDVTVQAQILDLLKRLQESVGLAIVLITHDLSVISHVADRVAIMYAGRKVEEGAARAVLRRPQHPYTARLLAAVPRRQHADAAGRGRLEEIAGRVPTLTEPASSCTFAARCNRTLDVCVTIRPELIPGPGDSLAACFNQVGQG